MTRRSMILAKILALAVSVLLAAAAACSGNGHADPALGGDPARASTAGVLSAWKAAGLTPAAELAPVDGARLGGGTCRTGTVDGVQVTLCELADAKAAAAAREAGLAAVGEATGTALVRGRLLLVIADRTKADPQGRTINKLAKTFEAAD